MIIILSFWIQLFIVILLQCSSHQAVRQSGERTIFRHFRDQFVTRERGFSFLRLRACETPGPPARGLRGGRLFLNTYLTRTSRGRRANRARARPRAPPLRMGLRNHKSDSRTQRPVFENVNFVKTPPLRPPSKHTRA